MLQAVNFFDSFVQIQTEACWICFKLHWDYFTILHQTEFTSDDIIRGVGSGWRFPVNVHSEIFFLDFAVFGRRRRPFAACGEENFWRFSRKTSMFCIVLPHQTHSKPEMVLLNMRKRTKLIMYETYLSMYDDHNINMPRREHEITPRAEPSQAI